MCFCVIVTWRSINYCRAMPSGKQSPSGKKNSKVSRKVSIESIARIEQLERQNYQQLKSDCIQQGKLFEDNFFPANNSSFYCKECKNDLKWLRPAEIKNDPQFCNYFAMTNNASYKLNVTQGQIGNLWFLGAIALLSLNKEIFAGVVPGGQSFDTDNYAGIFQFRFWYYGKWRTVVVDDRLPTVDGELIMLHDRDHSQFWYSLLEKAYAKLIGCYESLMGSYTSEALVDFTGGLCETYTLRSKDVPSNLFSSIYKSIMHSSLLVACIESEHTKQHTQLDNGLYVNHFYTLTAVNSIEIEGEFNQIQLVRLRNAWASISEWKGAWGVTSYEWKLISDENKERFGLQLEYNNEFWITFDDFKNIFTKIDICNLPNEKLASAKYEWKLVCQEGSWEPGYTAGGCSIGKGTFWKNPKYLLTVDEQDCDPDDDHCATVIVGLMQKYRKSKKSTGLFDLKIGFQIYSLDDTSSGSSNLPKDNDNDTSVIETNMRSLGIEYFHTNKPIAGTRCYINIREVFGRFRLKPGHYMVIPSTYQAHLKGSFLLRFLHEKLQQAFQSKSSSDSNKKKQQNSSNNENENEMAYSISRANINDANSQQGGLFRTPLCFTSLSSSSNQDQNMKINFINLYQFLKENILIQNIEYSYDKCQLLIALYSDEQHDGNIDKEQLQQLCNDLNECYMIFNGNKTTTTTEQQQQQQYINFDEMKKCFDQMGIYAGRSNIELVLNRYGTTLATPTTTPGPTSTQTNQLQQQCQQQPQQSTTITKVIDFNNFSICALKLRNVILYWDNKLKCEETFNKSNCDVKPSKKTLTFTLREFVQQMMYY